MTPPRSSHGSAAGLAFSIQRAAVAVGVLLLASACTRGTRPDETQVAARVNELDISVHQVQSILQRQPRAPGGGPASPAQVLEVLVDQELAAQAADKADLEKDPAVIQALQIARRETLAKAYHDRVAAKATQPSSDDIDRYYESHSELFSQRRFYTLQEFAVEASPEAVAKLSELVGRLRSADAVANVLRDASLSYSTQQLVRSAEDVPLGLLGTLAKTGVGQSVVLPQAGGARIFTVLQLQNAPIDRRTAADPIKRYLIAERQRALVGEAMRDLRKGASLQYGAGFADPRASAPQQAAASAPAMR